MAVDRTAVRWIERAIPIKRWVNIEFSKGTARLNEPAKPAVRGVGVPDILPIARLLDEVIKIGAFAETLGNESDAKIVVAVFEQAGSTPGGEATDHER